LHFRDGHGDTAPGRDRRPAVRDRSHPPAGRRRFGVEGRPVTEAALPVDGLGTPIKGPTALGSDPRRLLRLTWVLAVTDWRLRFFGSALGYMWSLVQPLMLFGVLYTVFSLLLNFSGDERFYPVALLLGIVMFSFLNEATGGAVRSLVNREN